MALTCTSGVEFAYVEGVVIDHVTPVLGPSSGGTILDIHLADDVLLSSSKSQFVCDFGEFFPSSYRYVIASEIRSRILSCAVPVVSTSRCYHRTALTRRQRGWKVFIRNVCAWKCFILVSYKRFGIRDDSMCT